MAQPAPAAAASLIPSTVKSYRLDKLTGPNYLTWATRVTLLLKRATLWDIVSGATPIPAPNDAAWLAQDLQAQSELMLHLGVRQVQMFQRCQTSAEIWAFLRSTYHHEGLITRVTTLKKLLISVLVEDQDTPKFLDDWRTLLDNALLSGLQLDESLQAMLLLAALPSSWRPFITTQASGAGLTVETLITRILQEDAMRDNTSTAITATPSSQYVQRPSNFRRPPFRRFNNARKPVNNPSVTKICSHCGRHGHLEHECRTKRREQQQNDRRPKSQLHHLEVPALSQYDMESLQLFNSIINSARLLAASTDTSTVWLLDTGATHHMTLNSYWLHNYKKLTSQVQVYLGDNHSLNAIGLGHLQVTLPSGAAVTIRDIYHNPGLSHNILSVNAAMSTGSSIEFFHNSCVIHFKLPNGQFETLKLLQQNRLYPIKLMQSGTKAIVASTSIVTPFLTKAVSTLIRHYRLGHINAHTLQRMAKHGLCSGLPPNFYSIDLCEGCLMGKASHKAFHQSQSRSSQLNQLVHSDLCGPMESSSLTGSVYFLSFIDDFSRYTTLYFLKLKSQVLTCFKEYCTLVMCRHDLPVQVLRSDNGGEYVSNAFQKFCKDAGYGDGLGVKAYRSYDPKNRKFHFACSVYFDESSMISPQQGITTPPHLTYPAKPFSVAPTSTNAPRIEWEEEDVLRHIPQPIQPAQAPPVQPIPFLQVQLALLCLQVLLLGH
ncbi:hypothetical protein L7F22_056084 [Adiantum nelumboides]|nr:hypothetical protein [Adiantum nelumboides]